MIGRACQVGDCARGSLILVVDIASSKLYLAVKAGDKPVIVSPAEVAWPAVGRTELGQWKSQ